MTQRMLTAVACIFVAGASGAQASTVKTFEILGQPYGGFTDQVSVDVSDLAPGHYNATLELQLTGDYDSIGETLSVQLDNAVEPISGIAGTDMNGNFHGFSVNPVRPGFIDFLQNFIISRENFMADSAADGTLDFSFLRSSVVGGGPESRLYGVLFIHSTSAPPTVATTPEPSTMVLASLGLACAGCCLIRRRRAQQRSTTA